MITSPENGKTADDGGAERRTGVTPPPLPNPPRPVGQRLSTPVYEQGVELKPEFAATQLVAPGIRRVWSTLWAFDGVGMRRVRCSPSGELVPQQPDFNSYDTSIVAGNANFAAWTVFDLGIICNWVQIAAVAPIDYIFGEFSVDNVNWGHRRYCMATDTAAFGVTLDMAIRAQFVRVDGGPSPLVVPIEVIGEKAR